MQVFIKPTNGTMLPCQTFTLHYPAVAFPDWLLGASNWAKKPFPISLPGNCSVFTIKILMKSNPLGTSKKKGHQINWMKFHKQIFKQINRTTPSHPYPLPYPVLTHSRNKYINEQYSTVLILKRKSRNVGNIAFLQTCTEYNTLTEVVMIISCVQLGLLSQNIIHLSTGLN